MNMYTQEPRRWPFLRFAVVLVGILTVVGITAGVAFAGAPTNSLSDAKPARAPRGGSTTTTTPTPCASSWIIVSSPQSVEFNELLGVAALSVNDVWAVG